MPLTDGQQTGELPLTACVRLQRHCVVAGDFGQPAFQLVDQLSVTDSLIFRSERMNVGKFGPGNGLHLSSGVELHGATAERDHGAVEGEIAVRQPPQPTQHLVFAAVEMEVGVGHELA